MLKNSARNNSVINFWPKMLTQNEENDFLFLLSYNGMCISIRCIKHGKIFGCQHMTRIFALFSFEFLACTNNFTVWKIAYTWHSCRYIQLLFKGIYMLLAFTTACHCPCSHFSNPRTVCSVHPAYLSYSI